MSLKRKVEIQFTQAAGNHVMSVLIVYLDEALNLVKFNSIKVEVSEHFGVIHYVSVADEKHNGQEQH